MKLKSLNCFSLSFSLQPNSQALQSKPPKCPQNSLSHLRGLVDVSPNTITTKAEICATPPQNRRRFFIPKHLRSPFGIYKNRSNGSSAGSEQNYTFSGKSKVFNLFFQHHNTSSSISREAFLHKNFSGISSMNSSTNSESALLANASPTQSITKVKHRDNKENKLQRFSGAVANALNGGTLVFGKIKSLWSHSNTNLGLNILADSERLQPSKSKENSRFSLLVLFSSV